MYLDPAFGGMVLQVALGIIAVGGAFFYSLRRRAKRLLEGKNKETDEVMGKIFSGDGELVDTLAEASGPAKPDGGGEDTAPAAAGANAPVK